MTEHFHIGPDRFIQRGARAFNIDCPETLASLGERYERDIVVDVIHALHGLGDRFAIIDVGLDEFHAVGEFIVAPQVEHAHVLTTVPKKLGNIGTDKTGSAGYQMKRHILFPSSTCVLKPYLDCSVMLL